MFLRKRRGGGGTRSYGPNRNRKPVIWSAERNFSSISELQNSVTTGTPPTRAETSSPQETTPPPHTRKSTQKSVQYNSSDTPRSPIPCTANSHSIAARSPISASNPLPATSPPLPESPPTTSSPQYKSAPLCGSSRKVRS